MEPMPASARKREHVYIQDSFSVPRRFLNKDDYNEIYSILKLHDGQYIKKGHIN